MDEKTRKSLERPFETGMLKQRQGPGNQTLTYVEVQAYIDRLNEAFDGDWSFEVTTREQHEDQVLVEGRLTAGAIVKTGLGGATVTRRRDDGKLVSLAGDFKKAEAEALKRACRLLGVGRDLYNDDTITEQEEPFAGGRSRDVDPRRHIQAAQGPPPTRPMATAHANPMQQPPQAAVVAATRSRLTAKQLACLWAIARKLNHDQRSFRAYVRQTFNVQPEFLTREQASQLIGILTTPGRGPENGNGHDASRGEPGEVG